MFEVLNQVFNFLLSLWQKKGGAKAFAEAVKGFAKKPKTWQQRNNENIYFANVLFNQRKSEIDEKFREDNGVESFVKRAQDMVKADPSLIPDATKRKRFLKQSPKKAAKSLCNTIAKYKDLSKSQKMPSFELFYIRGVNDGGLLWAGGVYTKQYEKNLVSPYCDYKKSLAFDFSKKKGFTAKQMLDKFKNDSTWQKACIRISTGREAWRGHTFNIEKNGDDIVMYDQYHNHWSGVSLSKRKCKITNVYQFVK